MKNNKGFAPIIILAIVLGVLAIGGVTYYAGKKQPDPSPIINGNQPDNIIDDNNIENDDNIISDNNHSVNGDSNLVEVDDIDIEDANIVAGDHNSSAIIANNQFTFDFYNQIKGGTDNIFVSPISISSAIAMTYEGARGKTAEEIRSVFHFPSDIVTLRNSFASINGELNKKSDSFQLSIANALWAQKDYKFLSEYLSTVEKYYGGKATNLDFKFATETARQTINKWVEVKTNDRIQNLIPSGLLNPNTRLVLTNAIYFNGKWEKPFDENGTRADTLFSVDAVKKVKVNMMQNESGEFGYAENSDLQIIELPYRGNKISMIILLPKQNDINAFEKILNLEKLNQLKKELKKQRVGVFLPQFKFGTKYFLAENLKKIGMPTAFLGGTADFSGMDGTRYLSIGEVIHQAFVDVNENGTEAAAATAVIMKTTAAPYPGPTIPRFYANHPFIFLIQDNSNGNILFMGKIINPK